MGRVCGHLAWSHGDQCPSNKEWPAAVTSHQPPASHQPLDTRLMMGAGLKLELGREEEEHKDSLLFPAAARLSRLINCHGFNT